MRATCRAPRHAHMQMRRRAPLTCNAAQRALAPVPPAGAAPKQEAVQLPAAPATFSVGSDAACDLSLSNGLVSGRHAELSLRDGLVFVADGGSTNGTFVDGARVAAGSNTQLRLGDLVSFAGADQLDKGPEPYRLAPVDGASGAPAIRLMGRFALPSGVMQSILIDRLYAWATGITVNGDLPIVLVLKVDREDDGVRMALCTGGMMGERLSEQCALKLAVEAVAGEDTVVSVWLMGGTADERALPDLPLIMTGMQVLLKQLRTEAVADLKRR